MKKRNAERNDVPKGPGDIAGRVPPHDLEAEAAVISAVLLDEHAFDRVKPPLDAEHFYAEAHRRIFEACAALATTGRPLDVVQVGGWLRDHDRLAQVGGMAYLTQVLDAAPAVANVEAYAKTVHDKWRLRRVIYAAQRIAAEGYGHAGDVDGFVDQAESQLYELARESPNRPRAEPMRAVLERTYDRIVKAFEGAPGRSLGIPTGLADLDEWTSGLHPGEQTILAARPGMGKTALMMAIAQHVALRGYGVLVFSLEMPSEQLGMRQLCAEGGVEVARTRRNRLDVRDLDRLTAACDRLTKVKHAYIEERTVGMTEIRSIVRMRHAEMKRDKVPLGLVAIDYAQILPRPEGMDPRERGEAALAENARAGKRLAKETGAHLLLLSQLNRSVETRSDKRPLLSDLRESGALEEAADTAIGVYRDEYYDRESDKRGIAELIILKQRNGPTGTIEVAFDGPTTTFKNLEQEAAQ